MGHEVRRVKAGWQHPKEPDGRYTPLRDGSGYSQRLVEHAQFWHDWYEKHASSPRGGGDPLGDAPFLDERENYMPEWTEEEATAWCWYENCSEGTPVSPVFETKDGLVEWLVAKHGGAVEQWVKAVDYGWLPSGFGIGGRFFSGEEFVAAGSPMRNGADQ